MILGGCLQPDSGGADSEEGDSDAPWLRIPEPETNAKFEYRSSAGDELQVRIGGVVERKGPWLNDRKALSLNITYKPDESSYSFKEALDPRSGAIVQQWARCSSKGESGDCKSEHGLALTGAHGLPGAFGAAPLWGAAIAGGTVEHRAASPLPWQGNRTYEIAVESDPQFEGSCVQLTPSQVNPAPILAVEITGGLAPFRMCEGISLPVKFEALSGTVFRLTDWTPGDRSLDTEGMGEAPERSAPLSLTDRRAPVYAASPEQDTPFPTTEAHQVVMNRVDEYEALFQAGRNGTVVTSFFSLDSSERPGSAGIGSNSTTWVRHLWAVDDRGRWVDVDVAKTRDEGGPMADREVSYEIREEGTGRTDRHPTRDTLRERGARLDEAIDLGEKLTGQEVFEETGYGLLHEVKGFPSGWIPDENAWRLRGSTIQVWYEQGSSTQSGGVQVVTPYQLVVDGPTGTVLWVYADRTTLDQTLR